jgi:hypothetical protein
MNVLGFMGITQNPHRSVQHLCAVVVNQCPKIFFRHRFAFKKSSYAQLRCTSGRISVIIEAMDENSFTKKPDVDNFLQDFSYSR